MPRAQCHALDELFEAYGARGIRTELVCYDGRLPELARCVDGSAFDAVLVGRDANFAPSSVLGAPWLAEAAGRRIPVACLPLTAAETVRRFATRAAQVQLRSRDVTALALLAQWQPRYLRVADRIQALLQGNTPTVRWTEELIGRSELVDALGTGLGLGLYVGHGRPVGWAGYHGTRSKHFVACAGKPLGAVVSLCCRTASRLRTRLSYAEWLPMLGVAAASFGAISDTLHTDNTRWAVRICEVLREGVATIGELIVRAAPLDPAAARAYRLIGDPLAPLATEHGAWMRASSIAIHA